MKALAAESSAILVWVVKSRVVAVLLGRALVIVLDAIITEHLRPDVRSKVVTKIYVRYPRRCEVMVKVSLRYII